MPEPVDVRADLLEMASVLVERKHQRGQPLLAVHDVGDVVVHPTVVTDPPLRPAQQQHRAGVVPSLDGQHLQVLPELLEVAWSHA